MINHGPLDLDRNFACKLLIWIEDPYHIYNPQSGSRCIVLRKGNEISMYEIKELSFHRFFYISESRQTFLNHTDRLTCYQILPLDIGNQFYLGSGVNAELQLGLLAVIHGESLHEQRGEPGSGSTAEGMEDKESLQSGALVSQLPDPVQH